MNKRRVPILNFYLYSILLIATPFLLLQNYLQTAVGLVSRATLDLGKTQIPYTVLIAVILVLLFFFLLRKSFTGTRWIALVTVAVMFAIGQLTSDYYFAHRFYDLQHNWHYLAYGIFSYIAYKRFSLKPRPLQYILMRIFLSAFSISLFDEFIQIYLSNRIFDLHDVAKDMWGNMIGVVFVFFFVRSGMDFKNYRFHQPGAGLYFTNPFSLLIIEVVVSYIFLFVSSVLSDKIFWPDLILITLLVFSIVFILMLLSRNKIVRWITLSAVLLLMVLILVNVFREDRKITWISPGLLSLNGVPLMYFDYLIYPEGGFRAVNKKTHFVMRDKQKIDDLNPDILLIGTGSDNTGGKGWNDILNMEISYNAKENKLFQIIKQPNPQACLTYNRLVMENKKVLFIIHNP